MQFKYFQLFIFCEYTSLFFTYHCLCPLSFLPLYSLPPFLFLPIPSVIYPLQFLLVSLYNPTFYLRSFPPQLFPSLPVPSPSTSSSPPPPPNERLFLRPASLPLLSSPHTRPQSAQRNVIRPVIVHPHVRITGIHCAFPSRSYNITPPNFNIT